jgi:hypothetical protein
VANIKKSDWEQMRAKNGIKIEFFNKLISDLN